MKNEFPKWKYQRVESGEPIGHIVEDRAEESELGEGWFDTPWEAKGETPKPIVAVGMSMDDVRRGGVMTARGPAPFAEYPKWITPPGGTPVIVKSQAEEMALLLGDAGEDAGSQGQGDDVDNGDPIDAQRNDLLGSAEQLPGPPRRGRPPKAAAPAEPDPAPAGQ